MRIGALLGDAEDRDRLSAVAELIVGAADGRELAERAAGVVARAD